MSKRIESLRKLLPLPQEENFPSVGLLKLFQIDLQLPLPIQQTRDLELLELGILSLSSLVVWRKLSERVFLQNSGGNTTAVEACKMSLNIRSFTVLFIYNSQLSHQTLKTSSLYALNHLRLRRLS